MMGIKLDDICKALRQKQRDSQHPQNFEEELCVAFKALGLNAQHLGGPNEPDIILCICNHQVAIDAKTTKEGVISETYVNFDAMERYGAKYEPNNIAVIAPGFSKGNIRDTARKRGVVLIETEAIYKLLEHHKIYPYTEEQIHKNLFSGNKEVIMPEDITPSTVEQETQLQIIRQIFDFKNITSFTLDKLGFLLQVREIAFTEANLQEVLRLLSEPPLNILVERQGGYSFTTDLETIKKRLGLVFRALDFGGQIEPPPGNNGKTPNKVKAGEFIHQGGGIFVWRKDTKVRIDVNKSSNEVEQTLKNYSLSATSMNNFYYTLRKKAGLLRKIR